MMMMMIYGDNDNVPPGMLKTQNTSKQDLKELHAFYYP